MKKVLNNIFFTIVFFILDNFLIWLIFNLISFIVIKYAYKKWQDKLLSPDERFMSLIILILLAIMFMLFIIAIIYVMSIFILYFNEIRNLSGNN